MFYYMFHFVIFTLSLFGLLYVYVIKLIYQEYILPKVNKEKKIKLNLSEKLEMLKYSIIAHFVFVSLLSLFTFIAWPFWKDIPSLVTNNCPVDVGVVTQVDNVNSRKNLSYSLVSIRDRNYKLTNSNKVYVGEYVRIIYLPHTKIIKKIDVYE